MNRLLVALFTLLAFSGCGGGSSASPLSVAPATAAPVQIAGRSVVFSVNGVAPKTVAQASRSTLSVVTVPTIVQAVGDVSGGQQFETWEIDTTTNPNAAVNDGVPSMVADQSAIVQNVSAVNSPQFPFAYQAQVVPPAPAKYMLTTAFSHATGNVPVYVYQGLLLSCDPGVDHGNTGYSWTAAGVISHDTTTPDLAYSCPAGTLSFPHGGMVLQAPTTDAYGEITSALTSVLTVTLPLALPVSTLTPTPGQILIVNTAAGVPVKVMPLYALSNLNGNNLELLALPGSALGVFAF